MGIRFNRWFAIVAAFNCMLFAAGFMVLSARTASVSAEPVSVQMYGDLNEFALIVEDKERPEAGQLQLDVEEKTDGLMFGLVPGYYQVSLISQEGTVFSSDLLITEGSDEIVLTPFADPEPSTAPVETETGWINPASHCSGYQYMRGFQEWHRGGDLKGDESCVVRAAAAGEVLVAGWGNEGEGYQVIIRHTDGYLTRYLHGSGEFSVKVGDRVSSGDDLMVMGCTGFCTDTHLHFTVERNGQPVDPATLIRFQ
ncbi:MAG: Murein DD-endopeptidase MepM [candidate division WS6 bacterium OLB20]|uniref:Murein DD-endopeptidase MepM n=1 Tax=candidate division WS6 bacterium OLB20 TaxID=1617426 RepID=A0A136LVV7_9BACT|nr:MAG: Murein DD-endopeptidase MepM [candidate division WS6 bacterium OLB20]